MPAPIANTLLHLGKVLREGAEPLVRQRLPWRWIDLLCRLDEKEAELMQFQPGDVVRLRTGSNEMTVSAILGADEVECTYFDGTQQFTVAVRGADLEKIDAPTDPNFPS
jgi:uncharacterized protein YodC (DUF2158 family)